MLLTELLVGRPVGWFVRSFICWLLCLFTIHKLCGFFCCCGISDNKPLTFILLNKTSVSPFCTIVPYFFLFFFAWNHLLTTYIHTYKHICIAYRFRIVTLISALHFSMEIFWPLVYMLVAVVCMRGINSGRSLAFFFTVGIPNTRMHTRAHIHLYVHVLNKRYWYTIDGKKSVINIGTREISLD